ncbi:MAG: hypothetical protein EXQ92_03890 [Alphaproteobacteria bacterium]|nr:hypothetical protein [Alphaproteobacteria bacterium]
MKLKERTPPRRFAVGHKGREIHLSHVADIELAADEQITLTASGGHEYDIVRKSWGYYATPSLNGRLRQFGLRSALVASGERRYLLLVEEDRMAEFEAYIAAQSMRVIAWLDGDTLNLTNAS